MNRLSKLLLIPLLPVLTGLCGCRSQENPNTVTVTSEVLNPAYTGNGVQWDPYDEAGLWGAEISDADWQKIYKRLDFMRPRFVRCLINSPYRYYDKNTATYDRTRNIASISRLLSYCQDNDITVLFGEYNPPDWSMKQDPEWISMAVDYLNYLVNDLGFTCIRYYNLFNEPDGYWSSTNGDYAMWKDMVLLFNEKMNGYPGLADKVKMAGPDVVVGYKNPASPYQPWEWISQTAADMSDIFGIYDIHAYPGQFEVRSGAFAREIEKYKAAVPEGRKLILGEAGFKYYKPEDAALAEKQNKRLENNRFTKGSDCNLLVYDYFYGLDIPILSIDMMNNGLSGMAVWMLDDAMHSSGDAGDTGNIKLWGMWNILGEEVFGAPEEEELRPWFYTWSLMCRYFPEGTDIMKSEGELPSGLRLAAGKKDGRTVLAFVNSGPEDIRLTLNLPSALRKAKTYSYLENGSAVDADGFPVPVRSGERIGKHSEVSIAANSFLLITDHNF